MLNVFQLLLSLVTQQVEDDQDITTSEPSQKNQSEQAQDQSEFAGQINPDSGDRARLDLGVGAAAASEDKSEASDEVSEQSNAANPSPIVSESVETEPEAADAAADIERPGVFEIENSIAEPETKAESGDSPGDVDVSILAPSELEAEITAKSGGDITETPPSATENTIGAVESHDETTAGSDRAIDAHTPEITSQVSETVDPVTSESSGAGEVPTAAQQEAIVSEDEAPSSVADVRLSETSEKEGQIPGPDIPAAESPLQAEVTATDQAEPEALEPDSIADSVETPLGFGVIDEIHNFAADSSRVRTQGAEQLAANTPLDSAGGVSKPSIVQQPREGGVARSEHRLSMPQVESEDRLILYFSIGLCDASDSEDLSTRSNSVRFTIEISGARQFEGVATESKWNEHAIDLSGLAGKEILITFLTACNNRSGGENCAALWGNPRILKLTRLSSAVERNESEPTAMKGLVIGSFNDTKLTGQAGTSDGGGKDADQSTGELSVEEFACESPTPVSPIADEISKRMVAEAKTGRASIGLPDQDFAVALFTELPKLELSALGLNTALVTVSEDFEVQCTLRNKGTAGLSPSNQCSVAINRVKLRRGRHVYPIKTLDAGDETKLVWNLRRFSRESATQISVSLKYQTPLGEVRQTLETVIEIQPAAPKLPSQIVSELHTHNLQEHVVLGNKHLRLLFVQGTRGFEYFTLFAARHGSYRQAATSHAMTTIRCRNSKNETELFHIIPTIY
ncbi:MAG: hypothetical protein OXI86_03755, partial [Candidatus Poribacteria bacterium]|nr:hypothetical protein [Candidatus Poribacteria bacterium]